MPPRDLLDEMLDAARKNYCEGDRGTVATLLVAREVRALRLDERRVWAMFAARALPGSIAAVPDDEHITTMGQVAEVGAGIAAVRADALMAEFRKRFPATEE